MSPKLKAYLDIGVTSFGVAFIIAVLTVPTPSTWTQAGQAFAAFLVLGAAITRQRLIHPPDGPAADQLGDYLAKLEPLAIRRVVNDPAILKLIDVAHVAADRAETAHALSTDTASMMVAHSVAGHLSSILANPPPPVLKAMLDNVESVAASTPVEPPPLPANDVTKGAS